MVHCWIGLGEVACDRGDLQTALKLLRRARHAARGKAAEVEAQATIGLARVGLRCKRLRHAAARLRHGQALARRHGYGHLGARAALLSAELELAMGRVVEARAAAEETIRLARERGLRIEEAVALRLRGRPAS